MAARCSRSLEFKRCFLCSTETSDHEESISKFSSEQECSFILSHILEVPFIENYLERISVKSGFRECPISYCTRCIAKITRVRDVLEQLENLEKLLIDEKHDIEMEFRRNCGDYPDRVFTPQDDQQLSHLDEIKNDILTDLRSSAIITMLERLQAKQVGKRSKPRNSIRVIRDSRIPRNPPEANTIHHVPVSNDLSHLRSTSRTKRLCGAKTSRNANTGESRSSKFTHQNHPAFKYEEPNLNYEERSEPYVLTFDHPHSSYLRDTEENYSASILPNCSTDEDTETGANVKEETDEDVPMMMVETAFPEDDSSLEELTFSEEPVSSENGNAAAATSSSNAFFPDPDNVKTVNDCSSEPNSVTMPKQKLYLITAPPSEPDVVVWPTAKSPRPRTSKHRDSSNSSFGRSWKPDVGQHPGPVTIRKKSNSSTRNICNWGNMSYADLITQAIQSSPEQRMTLGQIYDWIVKNAPFFKNKEHSNSSTGWKNTVRHNLSLHNNRFTRCKEREAGKSSWWMVILEP